MRCTHIKDNGQRCKANALKGGKKCIFHSRGMKYAGPFAIERAIYRKVRRPVGRAYRKGKPIARKAYKTYRKYRS